MASQVLYLLIGVAFAALSAHHLKHMYRAAQGSIWGHGTSGRDTCRNVVGSPFLLRAEAAVCVAILAFGIWLTLAASMMVFSAIQKYI